MSASCGKRTVYVHHGIGSYANANYGFTLYELTSFPVWVMLGIIGYAGNRTR